MTKKNDSIEKSIEILEDHAKDISSLARNQRAIADQQHENAHKLEKLGEALEVDASLLKSELDKKSAQAKAPASA